MLPDVIVTAPPKSTCVHAVAPGPLPGPRAQINLHPDEKSFACNDEANEKAPIPTEGVENDGRNARTEATDPDAGAT